MTDELLAERQAAMRALTDDERRHLIAGAGNVIGFGRFTALRRKRDLATAYRSSKDPA